MDTICDGCGKIVEEVQNRETHLTVRVGAAKIAITMKTEGDYCHDCTNRLHYHASRKICGQLSGWGLH
jgi:hypothetical protein